MHEQARLTSSFPAAGKLSGDLVSIAEIEKHFPNSQMANNALSFVCADRTCSVPVGAVVIERVKPGRKITPSSSFRARDRKKPHTCDLLPVPTATPHQNNGSGTAPAHPLHGAAPARWIDPRTAAASSSGKTTATGSSINASSNTASHRRSMLGSGQSQGQSKTVERFAREWDGMTVAARKLMPLLAGWNLGGTFFSAFWPLGYDPRATVGNITIFVGSARTVIGRPDGFDIVLNEQQAGGPELCVWVDKICLAHGAEGAALEKQLLKYANAPASATQVKVYVLGSFQPSTGTSTPTLRLELEHPHMMWLP